MKKILFSLCIILSVFGCGDKGNKAAFDELEQAKVYLQKNEFASAKDILDSLKTNYANDPKVQRARLGLMQEVELAESLRNISYIDSLLPVREADLAAMLPQFRLEKNAEYEDIGRYVDKNYNPTLDINNHFVRATVNERGEIALVSAHKGAAIKHTQVRVSDSQGNYAETESIAPDGGLNYTFRDTFGTTYETVTFQKGKDNGVIMFIYNYGDDKLSLERIGGKKTSPVVISNTEKQSIKRLADLSMALQDISGMKEERAKAEKRIEYLESKTKKEEAL